MTGYPDAEFPPTTLLPQPPQYYCYYYYYYYYYYEKVKGKVQLSLRSIEHQAIKTYRRVEV
jgi:hypothetical protein